MEPLLTRLASISNSGLGKRSRSCHKFYAVFNGIHDVFVYFN